MKAKNFFHIQRELENVLANLGYSILKLMAPTYKCSDLATRY